MDMWRHLKSTEYFLPQESCEQHSAWQPQRQHMSVTMYPNSQGSPTLSSTCPGTGMHWDVSCLAWHTGRVGLPLPEPCRAAQGSGREAKLFWSCKCCCLFVTPQTETETISWDGGRAAGLLSFFKRLLRDYNRLCHCRGSRLNVKGSLPCAGGQK